MQVRSFAVFLLVGLIWGSEWLAGRDLDSPPLGALALRYGIAALLLFAVILVHRLPRPSRRQAAIAAASGIGFAALPAILISWASGRISPGLLVVLLAMTPLLAALLEGRASGGLLAPLIGGVGGTALLAAQGLSFAATQWAGAAAALAAGALIAASVIAVKRRLAEVPVAMLAAIQLASGAVCVAGSSLLLEGRSGFVWSGKLIRAEAALALFGGALALPLYDWLLQRMESFQLTASQWVIAVAGIGEGLLLERQPPGWRMLAGAALVLASLAALLAARPEDEAMLTLRSTPPRS